MSMTLAIAGITNCSLELFPNKKGSSSTAQHRYQWPHPQSQLCACGRQAPKGWNASCHRSHARQRCGLASRLSWQLVAHRLRAGGGSFYSCAASLLVSPSDLHERQLADRDNLNRPAHGCLSTRPTRVAMRVATGGHRASDRSTDDRARPGAGEAEPARSFSGDAVFF